MIFHKSLAFLLGYGAFRLTPIFSGFGEFYGADQNLILTWFFEIQSGLTYLVFWLIYALIGYCLKIDGKIPMYVSSVIFGISYSVFEYPFSLMARWSPTLDWVGPVVPYMTSVIVCFLVFFILKKRSKGKIL